MNTKERPTEEQIEAEGNNEQWQTKHSCIRIILDSLALHDILAGQAAYKGVKVANELQNIDAKIHNWMKTNRTTATLGGSPVEWRNRELNHGADTQCNLTLDKNKTHMYEHHKIKQFIHKGVNLFIQTDGGCRGDGRSASGWRIRAVKGSNNECTTIAQGGTLYNNNHSSLDIEAKALNEAIEYLDNIRNSANNNEQQQQQQQHRQQQQQQQQQQQPQQQQQQQ